MQSRGKNKGRPKSTDLGFANTAGQVLRMVEEVDAPNVGVHFDTYHACLEERDLCAALEQVLQAGNVKEAVADASCPGSPG